MADDAVAALVQQGSEQLAEGRVEEAVQTFTAALAIDARDANALRGRGVARFHLKQWSGAAADFRAACDIAPADADNWVDLGLSLARDNDVYPAINVFETLLQQDPQCVRGHLELGLLHLRLGAIPKGRQHLERALACRPALEQRRRIEAALQEQDRLDRKRYYRPDFEALHQQARNRPRPRFMAMIRQALQQCFGGGRSRQHPDRHA